eukprot:gene27604-7241_t
MSPNVSSEYFSPGFTISQNVSGMITTNLSEASPSASCKFQDCLLSRNSHSDGDDSSDDSESAYMSPDCQDLMGESSTSSLVSNPEDRKLRNEGMPLDDDSTRCTFISQLQASSRAFKVSASGSDCTRSHPLPGLSYRGSGGGQAMGYSGSYVVRKNACYSSSDLSSLNNSSSAHHLSDQGDQAAESPTSGSAPKPPYNLVPQKVPASKNLMSHLKLGVQRTHSLAVSRLNSSDDAGIIPFSESRRTISTTDLESLEDLSKREALRLIRTDLEELYERLCVESQACGPSQGYSCWIWRPFMTRSIPGCAMLQWAGVDHSFKVPAGLDVAAHEDDDTAKCGMVPIPPSVSGVVVSVLVDELSGTMWTGHKGGAVASWSLSHGNGAQFQCSWQVNAKGHVTCLAITSVGELWTGSATGAVRVWSYCGSKIGKRPPTKLKDCRRQGTGSSPHVKVSGPAHVLHMASSSTGRTVWSAGKRSIHVWDAHSLQCLGTVYLADSLRASVNANSLVDELAIDVVKWLGTVYLADSLRASVNANSLVDELAIDVVKWLGTVYLADSLRASVNANSLVDELAIDVVKGLESVLHHLPSRLRPFHHVNGDASGSDTEESVPSPSPGSSSLGVRKKVFKGASVMGHLALKIGKRIKNQKINSSTPRGAYAGMGRLALKIGKRIKNQKMNLSTPRGSYTEPVETTPSVNPDDKESSYKGSPTVDPIHIWAGSAGGRLTEIDVVTGQALRSWKAHMCAIMSISCVSSIVFTLSLDGSIRGWPASPPQSEHGLMWQEALRKCVQRKQLRIVSGTWNTNESRPSKKPGLEAWLGQRSKDADLVMVGLQEVEMGTSSVAIDRAKSALNKRLLERGNQNAQWWVQELANLLGKDSFSKVALRQMSGMLVIVFCRSDLMDHVGEVSTASVACGILGLGGNKGGVGVSLSLYRRKVMMLCSHLAAHQDKVDERNADYCKIMRLMRFYTAATKKAKSNAPLTPQQILNHPGMVASGVVAATGLAVNGVSGVAGACTTVATHTASTVVSVVASELERLSMETQNILLFRVQQRGSVVDLCDNPEGGMATSMPSVTAYPEACVNNTVTDEAAVDADRVFDGVTCSPLTSPRLGRSLGASYSENPYQVSTTPAQSGIGIMDAELLVWVGDFNYRVASEYSQVIESVKNGELDKLLLVDQLKNEMAKRTVFHGMSEGPITFPPTYKYDKGIAVGEDGHPTYDTSEKKRVPSWTDRIVWRGSEHSLKYMAEAVGLSQLVEEEEVKVSLRGPAAYTSVPEVLDSDHKPVVAELDIVLPIYDQ